MLGNIFIYKLSGTDMILFVVDELFVILYSDDFRPFELDERVLLGTFSKKTLESSLRY